MVTYKNLFPEDFANLHKQKGKLYEFFNKKPEYRQNYLNQIRDEIRGFEEQIKNIENEKISSIEELRMIYIQKLINKFLEQSNPEYHINPRFHVSNSLINFQNAVSNEHFPSLLGASLIKVYSTSGAYFDGSFTDNEKEDYKRREGLIDNKTANKVNEYKKEIEKRNEEIKNNKLKKVKEIFQGRDLDVYLDMHLDPHLNKPLIRKFIKKGYINENYHDYISLFHDVTMTKSDNAFLICVKSSSKPNFEHELVKADEVITRMSAEDFHSEGVLNFKLLDTLSANSGDDYQKKYNLFLEILTGDTDITRSFIREYIERSLESESSYLNTFINLLCKKYHKFWTHVIERDVSDEKKQEYLRLILKYSDLKDIKALNNEENHLSHYIATLEGFPELASKLNSQDKIRSLLTDLEIKFKSLKAPDEATRDLFNFICENNLYEINTNNISSVVQAHKAGLPENDLKEKNYTTILSSECKTLIDYINENISEYVGEVLLKIPENKCESEEAFKTLLNREDLDDSFKENIIKKLDSHIERLSEITKKEIQASLLENKKVKVSWQNIFAYYKSLGECAGFDQLLVTILNDEFYYKPLSNKFLNKDIESGDEDFIKEFCRKLVLWENLNLESFKSLIKSVPYTFLRLDLIDLSKEKVECLIDLEKLSLTKENLESLKNNQGKFGDLYIKIIKQHFSEFIENYDNYDLNIIDLGKLLESNINDRSEEEKLLENILEGDYIQQNESLAEIFSKRLCDLGLIERFSIKYDILKALFDNFINSSEPLENKIKLLNHNFGPLTDDEIKNLIETFSDNYKNLFNTENKTVSFSNTKSNLELFKKMKERRLIENYTSPKKAASDIKVTPLVVNT